MKKIYLFASALFIGANIQAQQVIDFESVSLSPESYDNGSLGPDNFDFGDINLSNSYDDTWGSWSGFSISNITDNTTAGFGNQYSAYTGGGNNSENYGVFYPSGEITGENMMIGIMSISITNATYSAISMRDGDAFAKQFGSVNGPDGNPDGTNGEDFFKVWVIGWDHTGAMSDSVEFYLADYRFADDQDDYIVEDWNTIDLMSFPFLVNKVTFRFESSDVGDWGMNTPAYFAIDDITYDMFSNVNETTLTDIDVFPNPVKDRVTVRGEYGDIVVRDMSGRTLVVQNHNQLSTIDFSAFSAGTYFLTLSNEKGTFTEKISK